MLSDYSISTLPIADKEVVQAGVSKNSSLTSLSICWDLWKCRHSEALTWILQSPLLPLRRGKQNKNRKNETGEQTGEMFKEKALKETEQKCLSTSVFLDDVYSCMESEKITVHLIMFHHKW